MAPPAVRHGRFATRAGHPRGHNRLVRRPQSGISRRDAIIAEWMRPTRTGERRPNKGSQRKSAAGRPERGRTGVDRCEADPKSFDEWVKGEKCGGTEAAPTTPSRNKSRKRAVYSPSARRCTTGSFIIEVPWRRVPAHVQRAKPLNTLLPNTQEMRRVANLLELDVLLSAHDGKGNYALDSGLAALAVAEGSIPSVRSSFRVR